MTPYSIARKVLPAILACWLVTACSHYKPLPLRNPASDDEAGRVEVALVSGVPFEAMRAGFDPKFELKATDALTEALVTTQATQTTVNTASQLLVSAAVPGAAAIASAPTPKTPDSLPAAGTPPATAAVSQHNAMLRYQLASSLLQEVAMLNSYVRDAPRRAGYDPFIVRLKVTVRPLARATPFDMQSDIKFSAGGQGDVYVVPLLASDSEDATSASSLDRNLAQFGLALSALKGAYGLGATLSHNADDIVTSLGWQYQNVSNVARIDDQTISLRVNAQPTGVNRFELAARAHYVTALLLVKRPVSTSSPSECMQKADRPCADIRYQAETRFIHAVTGKAPGEADYQAGVSPRRVQDGSAQLFFWPDPVLPTDKQVAPLILSGDKAPFSAKLKLRGGDNLTSESVLRAELKAIGINKTLEGCSSSTDDSSFVIPAAKITAESGARDTLALVFDELSARVKVRLACSQTLDVILIPGAEVRRNGTGGTVKLTVTPDPIDMNPDDPVVQSNVTADARITVSRQGTASLGVSVKLPTGTAAATVKAVSLAFENVLPAGVNQPGSTQASACATLEKGQVFVRSNCSFDVALKNLPLPPQATPVSMKVTAYEYADEKVPASAKKSLPAVSLQYPVHLNCEGRHCSEK